MTLYGEQIGKKFEPDGSPRWYPGNTVIADVTAGSSGYVAMTRVREMALASGIGDTLILLPEDSYHMTVLRGLNDQVRTDAFWPAALPKDAPMSAVDDYVSRAVARVPMPGPARMRFAGVRVDAADFRVLLAPAGRGAGAGAPAFPRPWGGLHRPVFARARRIRLSYHAGVYTHDCAGRSGAASGGAAVRYGRLSPLAAAV